MTQPEISADPYLSKLNTFIETTAALTAQQLKWLAFMERWSTPAVYQALDSEIEAVIAANVALVAQTAAAMSNKGKNLLTENPETNQPATVVGFGYSTEQASYQVCIMNPNPITIPLKGSLQIGDR